MEGIIIIDLLIIVQSVEKEPNRERDVKARKEPSENKTIETKNT